MARAADESGCGAGDGRRAWFRWDLPPWSGNAYSEERACRLQERSNGPWTRWSPPCVRSRSCPAAEWHGASPSLPALVLFYGCLAALPIWSDRRERPVDGRNGLLMLLVWWMWSPRLMLDGDRFRITFLDVSQGDSAVLELPGGEVVLIDGGASYERFDMGRSVVAPYLWNRGIRTIDYVIATHPQLDHVGGLTYVLRHFTVRHVWGTGDTRQEVFYQRLSEALAEQGLTEHAVRDKQDTVMLGDCLLKVLNPSSPALQRPVVIPPSGGACAQQSLCRDAVDLRHPQNDVCRRC